MSKYKDDPRWIESKLPGTDQNGRPYRKGERVFYYPRSKVIVSGEAAKAAAAEFETSAADEESAR